MFLRAVAFLALALPPGAILAQSAAPAPSAAAPQEPVSQDIQAIFDAMRLAEMIDVMAEEGRTDAVDLAASLFPLGQVPGGWTGAVETIYDPAPMAEAVLADLATALDGADTAAIRAFLDSAPGRRMIELETAARREMADPEAEQAAKEDAAVALAEDSPRLDLLRRYIESTDLIEGNVAGAMNSNYAYVMGLLDGGAMQREMTESDVLSDISGQEPRIRADTTEWVYSFLLKAYAPAQDADLEAVIGFAATEPGRALNRALFSTFDARYREISRALGLTAARYMTTREI
jgi:hypothetical protein